MCILADKDEPGEAECAGYSGPVTNYSRQRPETDLGEPTPHP